MRAHSIEGINNCNCHTERFSFGKWSYIFFILVSTTHFIWNLCLYLEVLNFPDVYHTERSLSNCASFLNDTCWLELQNVAFSRTTFNWFLTWHHSFLHLFSATKHRIDVYYDETFIKKSNHRDVIYLHDQISLYW